jgi:putative peptidoglycan lipid II flippase
MAPWLTPQASLLTQASALALLIASAMVVYFGIAFAIGGAEFGMLRRNIERGRKPAE